MDKFIKFFTAEDEEEDEFEEYEEVDPVIEARRKEKFSQPLIYDEEDEKEEEIQTQNRNTFVIDPVQHKTESKQTEYVIRDIISPFSGVEKQYSSSAQKENDKEEHINIPTYNKTKSSTKVNRIVSPYFGYEDDKEENKKEEVKETKVEVVYENKTVVDEKVDNSLTLEHNLFDDQSIDEDKVKERQKELEKEFSTGQITQSIRNLSQMIAEEEENLKIIEGKTGEFQLKLDNNEDSLVDNVEDTMSLDDLMSLYEKKFKD